MWPIAGVSSLDVDFESSCQTVQAALDSGINHFDTAYSYGYQAEADVVLRHCLSTRWNEVVISTKVGQHYTPSKKRVLDARPETLKRHTDEILSRLGRNHVDILYLHSPDPSVPIEESARALEEIFQAGKTRCLGISNVSTTQAQQFSEVVMPSIIQPAFNMLQPETMHELRPFIEKHDLAVASYWPFMKGLLAGKLTRDYPFDPSDRRLTYPMFQSPEWEVNQDFVDVLREISNGVGCSVSQLVAHWTLSQPNITTVLCGAKRPEQIVQSASGMNLELPVEIRHQLDHAIESRLKQTL
jgi:aryl-alcohol dehydrogenase-like predicted oxidoreductase